MVDGSTFDQTLTGALGMTDLNGGAFCDAEFGIGHRGSTLPERSGVALDFRGRPLKNADGDIHAKIRINGQNHENQ